MDLENVDTPAKVIQKWEKGRLGKAEFLFLLVQSLTPENVEDCLKYVPPDVFEELKAVTENAPKTDEEWGRTFSIRSWCGPWNERIAARVHEDEKLSSKRYRIGIECLRGFLHQKA